MDRIFVIGAGTMGLDIAQVFAEAGKHVVVRDIGEDILQKAAARLEKVLARRVEKGKLTPEDKTAMMSRIRFMTSLEEASQAQLVVEAIVENIQIKKALFAELDALCEPECIFASNTSSISITEIASATKRPDRFIGMHFFNPATLMKLIEIIRGAHTSDGTFEAIHALSIIIGKEPVAVNEAPGFVVNRLLIPMINEACCIVESGVATPEAVDTAMKLGANHPMGPLALGDLIGLDVCLAVMDSLYGETHDTKFRASGLLRKMVRAGLLGRKAGKGFYAYSV